MGIILITISLPFYYFYYPLGILLSFIGILVLIVTKQKIFSEKIKVKRAKKIYKEIRYSFPISEETFELSKLSDISPNINSHKIWLLNALDAFEKEYRISKTKMFCYNRNHSAAKYPYIVISLENMNYKKGEEYEKLFLKKDNYTEICKFLNRKPIENLKKELEKFTILVEKQLR